MLTTRLHIYFRALALGLMILAALFVPATHAQTRVERELQPVKRRLPAQHRRDMTKAIRPGGYVPIRANKSTQLRTRAGRSSSTSSLPGASTRTTRRPARPSAPKIDAQNETVEPALPSPSSRITFGTPLSRVLHTSQLSRFTAAGSNEQLTDRTGDLAADERTTFDARGGSFDIAAGRSGSRYEVFTALDDNGTGTTSDDYALGVIILALDANGDFVRDEPPATFDLERDFGLPSAASVVAGTSRAGREFVIVSSSGYYNFDDPADPANEPSAGVVLLVRAASNVGFDNALSRSLVSVGSNQLNNANALALLPNNDLVIADFDSNELRIVRDTNADGIPDTLDPTPFYAYQFSDDAPLDIAANSRGVVFSHSGGNDAVLLAIYDDDANGYADVDEVAVEGLSLDSTLILHGLAVDRVGTVYIIEDASGADDTVELGGNGGAPRIDAFPDPALNGILRDGVLYAVADAPDAQYLTGLSFGVETVLGAVGRLDVTNSASRRGRATRGGLATLSGSGLTRGARGASQTEATTSGIRVTVEGRSVPVLSFSDTHINISLPANTNAGFNAIVASTGGHVTAAEDVAIADANPGLFSYPQTGAGEAIALLVSGNRYLPGAFPATFNGQPPVIALFGTGWRNSLPVSVTVGGRSANVVYAGQSGGFNGLDQINVALPAGISGTVPVVVTTANGATSRADVVLTVN